MVMALFGGYLAAINRLENEDVFWFGVGALIEVLVELSLLTEMLKG